MRAKVAKHAGTHALDKELLAMSELEIALLYMQALKEEDKQNELIKTLNDVWTRKFDNHFEMLQVFINHKMYKSKLEMKDIEKHREEIDENNFLEEWDKLMETIPEQYIVDEPDAAESLIVDDPEFEEMVAGWVQPTTRFDKE